MESPKMIYEQCIEDRTPKEKKNPISNAICAWLPTLLSSSSGSRSAEVRECLIDDGHTLNNLFIRAPKRWSVYEPMILLPSGSFTEGPWPWFLSLLEPQQREALWVGILREISAISPANLTHLAINEGIPLTTSEDDVVGEKKKENFLRSPSGLKLVCGDFGPESSPSTTEAEFEEAAKEALWVSTKQNGITQTWAPRWTMFSRGNVKEKTRLLTFHSPPDASEVAHKHRDKASLRSKWAVDLYAGIGYFVFSYAKLGMRVLCWELNPWSVEGLRRGALANKWSVKVIQGEDDLLRPTPELVAGEEQIIVFLESNEEAERRIRELRDSGQQELLDILHVNCGFLPTSAPTWQPAWNIVQPQKGGGWLHLHENVGVRDIASRRDEIQSLFNSWQLPQGQEGRRREVRVEHVEQVKTYAPDVWHVVFDVYITPLTSPQDTTIT
ncbi:tRNA wybutosine-synthesizing protein 2 [Diplogelasinospora grovesii]|uniref:tRNA wybutosine-synthesizing protein 2 n=1 Tax=Diplogelasinospora grovesii TaxID=303347 RepID=A0AAN6S5B7_9PEZI|nr:tRNA wybutosine-synthesizing protein 2 [Diplogelasinospora grovesii]